jgi:hypothetical protein
MVPNSLKMNLKSSYQANYSGVSKLPAESGKRPDQLHCGLPWTGGSTYKQMFQNPSSSETLNYDSGNGKLDNINYKHQYGRYLLTKKLSTAMSTRKDNYDNAIAVGRHP